MREILHRHCGILQKRPCPCVHMDEREIQNSVGTLISLFTFLLLSFDVLLWCCFDFLDPGSTAKSNPCSQGHTTGRKFFSISDSAPISFAMPPHPYHWVSEASRIELVQGLKAMEFLDLILCPISTSASINESGAAVLLRTAGSR